jgi:hypothetical protein
VILYEEPVCSFLDGSFVLQDVPLGAGEHLQDLVLDLLQLLLVVGPFHNQVVLFLLGKYVYLFILAVCVDIKEKELEITKRRLCKSYAKKKDIRLDLILVHSIKTKYILQNIRT